jgi:uncharacterized membrane protein
MARHGHSTGGARLLPVPSPNRPPFSILLLAALLGVLLLVIQFGIVTLTFERLGLTTAGAALLLLASLLGSAINIPLFQLQMPIHNGDDMHLLYRLLGLRAQQPPRQMIVAINLGGGLIPVAFCVYLLLELPLHISDVLLATTAVAVISYAFSRPVPGMGIMMPILVAPLTAALAALMLNPLQGAPLAYIAGTLGVLLGADLLRIMDVRFLHAPLASIGGAGTFDGVFITGIVAVLLTG